MLVIIMAFALCAEFGTEQALDTCLLINGAGGRWRERTREKVVIAPYSL